MSFPRAKLHRFNDISNCTPSPADYNPKIKSGPGGAVISQTERFTEPRSPAVSESGSINSINSSPCFRTPTLPKKKVLKKPLPKQKSIDLLLKDPEALKYKIVECNNKDIYINELTEQIEEMKVQISQFKVQKEQLLSERGDFESKTEKLRDEHRRTLDNLNSKHSDELKVLYDKINGCKLELIAINKKYDEYKQENHNDMLVVKASLDQFQGLYETTIEAYGTQVKLKDEIIDNKERELRQLEASVVEIRAAHAGEVKELQSKHKNEILDIEFEMLKSITNIQKELEKEKSNCAKIISEHDKQKAKELFALQTTFEQEKLKLQREAEAQIRQIEEDSKEANVLAEMQMQERCKDVEVTWQIKLKDQEKQSEEILKECQAISEYNIIQCELEKNDIKRELSDKIKELEDVEILKQNLLTEKLEIEMKYQNLTLEYDLIVAKLSQVQDELATEKAKYVQERQQAVNDKHTYDVTISKTHKTIDALKKRLFDSDRDVEQLKSELETCELSKLEFESRVNQLTDELEDLTKLNEDLEFQSESSLKMYEEKIHKIQNELVKQVEEYRKTAAEEMKKLNDKLDQKSSQCTEAMEQLHHQQALNSEAQSQIHKCNLELERIEADNMDCRFKNGRLESTVQVVRAELATALRSVKNLEETKQGLESKLKEQVAANEELKMKYEEAKLQNEEVEFLERQVNKLQEKNESNYKYCEYYKNKANEYEQEIEDMNKINKKYIDQSGRYDELLQKFEALVIRNSELEKKVEEQETLIGPFRAQLEAYEMERSLLLNQKSNAENEAKAMGLKYAEILGHQNQKQKIKHLVDLKKKNYDLAMAQKQMEVKLCTQTKTIEKLKKELASFTKPQRKAIVNADKENLHSPNVTLNSSYNSSPLRDRN